MLPNAAFFGGISLRSLIPSMFPHFRGEAPFERAFEGEREAGRAWLRVEVQQAWPLVALVPAAVLRFDGSLGGGTVALPPDRDSDARRDEQRVDALTMRTAGCGTRMSGGVGGAGVRPGPSPIGPWHLVIALRANDGPERGVLIRVSVTVPGAWASRRSSADDLPIARECFRTRDQDLAALTAYRIHDRKGQGRGREGEKGTTDHHQRRDSLPHLNLLSRKTS